MPRKVKGVWEYPHSADVLAVARLQPIAAYVARRRRTVPRSIEGRPILEECQGAERARESPSRQYWWEQEFALLEEEVVGGGKPPGLIRHPQSTSPKGLGGNETAPRRRPHTAERIPVSGGGG